jgi:hypothetical protein
MRILLFALIAASDPTIPPPPPPPDGGMMPIPPPPPPDGAVIPPPDGAPVYRESSHRPLIATTIPRSLALSIAVAESLAIVGALVMALRTPAKPR